MRVLPFSILLLLILSAGTQAQSERESIALRNTGTLYVGAIMEQPAPGLDADRFILDTRLRLQRAGIPLVRSGQGVSNVLRVSVLPKQDTRRKVFAVAVTLELLRVIDSKCLVVEFSTVWMRRDVVIAESWQPVHDSVAALVGEFVRDWKRANGVVGKD